MLFSSTTVRAILGGMRAVGLDADALRQRAGIDAEVLARLDGVVEAHKLAQLWMLALERGGREELPVEVGLAIPYGAFGALDYLAGSAADVAAGFASLARHFRQVSSLFSLEIVESDDGGVVRVVWSGPFPVRDLSDEVTIAICVGHFRAGVVGGFGVRAVSLTRPRPARPERYEALFGAPVTFGAAISAMEIDEDVWARRLRNTDPTLQETLQKLTAHLGLGDDQEGLAVAARRALARLLPDVDPSSVARALGLSERSLQRRLQKAGTSYKRVLDAFREAEAERLLARGVPLSEVALRLGFSDQTAWNRAFKRWKGTSPRAWLAARPGPASPPPRA